MATLATLTADVREMLYGTGQWERPLEDTLSTAVTNASDTEWRFVTDAMWKRGDYAEFYDGSTTSPEVVLLTEDHPPGADATVRRAQRNTTAAGGFSVGDVFLRLGPGAVTALQIERFINQVIDTDLWPAVWMLTERTLTYTSGDTTYELNANDVDVLRVYQYNIGSDNKFWPVPRSEWEVVGQTSTSVSSTGKLLRLFSVHSPAETVYYTARTKPSSSNIGDLSTALVEMVPWAVVAKLIPGVLQQPSRHRRGRERGNQPMIDATYYRQEFDRMRAQHRNELLSQLQPYKRWVAQYGVG